MVAANGTPIRLVQESGGLIELDAQSIALTTSRKAGGMAVPFSGGQRWGLDMNMQKAIIVVNGVFTDDKEVVGSDTNAFSIIDFTLVYPDGLNTIRSFLNSDTGIQRGNLTNLFDSQNTYLLGSDTLSLTYFTLCAADGSCYPISFKKLTSGTVTNTTNGLYIMGINPDSNSMTATVLRDGLISLINNEPNLAARFTATTVDSPIMGIAGAVKITQDISGIAGNNVTPTWRNLGAGFDAPYTTDFTGGTVVAKKSAGDKAMDLYGLMNNMKKAGAGKTLSGVALALLGGGLSIGSLGTGPGAIVGVSTGAGLAATGVGMAVEGWKGEGDDYIIGIQIPYNSTIQAGGKTYTARNFIMPTGLSVSTIEKSSAGNVLEASADLTKDGNRAGIRGVVQKLDITYEAGENVYGFQMNFIPVDRSI